MSLFDAAQAIGDALVASAYVHEGRCTWAGRVPHTGRGGVPKPATAVADAHLYSGTAGIGLFLAELYAKQGDDRYRRVARGALQRSLDRVETRLDNRLSLFNGLVGVLYAVLRAAPLLDDTSLLQGAMALAPLLDDDGVTRAPLDAIAGHAGAVPALSAMRGSLGDARALGLMARLGADIAAKALRGEEAWCWETATASGADMGPTPLTGLGHGASGMGLALLEVAAATGDRAMVAGGQRAFAYERRWFDEARANWVDLRAMGAPSAAAPRGFGVAWCHGAPGIGLARLRAVELFPELSTELRPDIDAALQTTVRALDNGLSDATLCHGEAGLAEVLITGARVLGRPELHDRAARVAERMIQRHGASVDYPSGVPGGGPNPSLMLGLAGVGLFLLRALDPLMVKPILVSPL